MANGHETGIVIDPKETQNGWQSFEKPIPQAGKLLAAIDEFFLIDPSMTVRPSEAVIDYAERFSEAHARWELVRHSLARNLVGDLPNLPLTGAEKWAAGLSPGRIISVEATAVGNILDEFARKNKYSLERRKGLEKVIFGREFTNTQALRDVEGIFLGIKNEMTRVFESTATPAERQRHEVFINQIITLAKGVPFEYSYDPMLHTLTQRYKLRTINNIQKPTAEAVDLNTSQLEHYKLLAGIGIIGMPVLRAAATLDSVYYALRKNTSEYNYAFKGSRLRERLQQDLLLRFVTEIGSESLQRSPIFHISRKIDPSK